MTVDSLPAISPPTDRTLVDQVVRQIRTLIILGRLTPGERLPEVRLAQQFNIARSTLREALRRLEAESLIESVSHRGSRVARLDPEDAVEISELHVLLEARAVQQLSLPIDRETQSRLCRIVDQMRTLTFPDDANLFIDLDDEFHRTIVAAAGQRRLLQLWLGMSSLLSVLVALTFRYIQVEAPLTAQRHQDIVEALSQPDRQRAAAVVTDHYRSLSAELRQAVEVTQRDWNIDS